MNYSKYINNYQNYPKNNKMSKIKLLNRKKNENCFKKP